MCTQIYMIIGPTASVHYITVAVVLSCDFGAVYKCPDLLILEYL